MQKTNPHSIWSPAPDALDLQDHQVDIWRAQLKLPNDSLKLLEATLSSDETRRAALFHFPVDRDHFIAAHGHMRNILARYLHREPDQLSFSTNQYGKPALRDHKLEFNISHSAEFVLVAVTQDHRVGVDVERIRQGISSLVIARHYFSKSEFDELQTFPPEQKEAAFFICWTRKEAFIKAQGLGLSLPLESFDVSLSPNEPAFLRATRPDPQEASRWTLSSLEIGSGYASAVAVEGKNVEFRLWDWH